ncbi:TonB-dependent receptor [Gracilimonas tropica]|uniref:TonB-dependent receptor n=1 Tax=Gracilimonas tropica TaxID=454600 RepID=UPI000365698E|nr:carboxypeptidase-like regulatory domain-containing protein [Gracilimonas tropica]
MDVKKLLSLLFLGFIYSHLAFAQTGKITGFVTDENGEPLPGVNIIIEGTTQGTSSAVDGYYQILNVNAGIYSLKATYVGFTPVVIENVEVNINLTTEVDIEMREETLEGEEVVVTARQPVVKKDVSSSQANISEESIDALPVTSVNEVVSLQAGIEDGLSIRGSGADEVAFNLNGFSLRSERDNTPFTGISVTSIENVQVQTGGFNAEYGNIRSGVINVTSKEGSRDRYTVDGIFRITPPQQKNVGQRINDPNSYWLRPFLDDEVAWTGTNNGAWDQYTQETYPAFMGWNAFSQQLLGDDDPNNDLTPEAAQQAFLYQHRKDMAITEPDYEVDLTIGGPVPVISEKLGDLRFSASFRETQTMYMVPLSRDRYKQRTFQGKLTSNVAPGMKLSIDGMYSNETGTGASQSGNPGFFVSPSGIASNMDQVSYIESRIYASDYWAPSERVNANIGAQFTHSINNNTFYEVKVNNYFTSNSTNPGAFRDTSDVYTIGGVGFSEAPFGFYDETSFGVASGMRMGVGMSTSRDSSEISVLNTSFAITSQVDRVNLVKAGFEFVRTHSKVNYGSFDKVLRSGRTRSVWDTTPLRGALFVQDKMEFNGMIANLGLRLTYSDPNIAWYDYEPFTDLFNTGNASALDTAATSDVSPQVVLQPRLGVSFPITDNSKLFFNYGHFVQLPDPENLYLVRVEPFTNTVTRVAAPENKLPKTIAYELGYEQNIFDNYLVRVSGYYKDLINQPITVGYVARNGSDSYSVSRPFSYEDIRGLEFTLRKQAGRFFWGEVNYTYHIESRGFFGTLVNYENPFDQRNYERTTNDNDITRPVPRPFARLQLYFQTPYDFGPRLLGTNPLGGWQIVPLVNWRAGQRLTYTGGGSIPGIVNNLQARDVWTTSLRLTKRVDFNDGSNIKFFADISNVLNTRNFNVFNAGLIDGNDYLDYMGSLHLPKNKLEEIGLLNSRVPGSDKVGDYRPAGVEYVPIEATPDLNNIASPNGRALYYDTQSGVYYQYQNGTFVEADNGYVNDVLDDKAYINMPNQEFFHFLDPRTIRFGIRFSF